MRYLQTAWHWLSTSRYTRELESQRNSLLTRVELLERENLALMIQVYPRLGQARQEAQTGERVTLIEPKPRMR